MTGAAARARGREPVLLGALLAVTAVAYLWSLGINGYSNEYYSMAVQAGSSSWKAWFFGSLDASNAITVDKTPGSLWVMGLSGRIFGFGTLSMLIPQALLGVASVATLYAAVRRWFSTPAALVAGAVLATTPVAAMIFRFNNPDALLVLLMTAAAYAVTRAIDSAERAARWLILAGALIGFAFLTKMMQAFLVLPGFVMAYAIAGRATLMARVRHLLAALVTLVVAGGWWIAVVELVPASARPYIGGSQHNSILELTLGYNGFGRLSGNETGSVSGGGGGNAGGMWGQPGLTRLFSSEMGSQISWLLPTALIATIVLAACARRSDRTDRMRAYVLIWGGWLLVTGLTFSLMQGIIHPYYMVALAPAIGALVGAGATTLWNRRGDLLARAVLAGTVILTAAWIWVLLSRTSDWNPWLRFATAGAGIVAAVLILIGPELPGALGRRVAILTASLVAVVAFTGPTAYAVQTVATAHTGALPSAGPSSTTGRGGVPGAGGRFLGGSGTSGIDSSLIALLRQGDDEWSAATVTANGASPLALASGEPILAVGGFNGTDPFPSLATFKEYVASGRIHYFVVASSGGGGGPMQAGNASTTSISSWVEQNFTSTTVGSFTVYDLTSS